jgi:hypothetical protein
LRTEMRWADISAALNDEPEQKTFTLVSAHALNAENADELRSAVYKAFSEADDQWHPPLKALRYREEKLQGLNPAFTVKGAILDGTEQFQFALRPGKTHRIAWKTRTEADAEIMKEAHDFGSRAELTVRTEDIIGLPVFSQPPDGESSLTLQALSRRFRLGLTSQPLDGGPSHGIELDAELARGAIGWEIRSAEAACPFAFRTVFSDQSAEARFVFSWDDRLWEGRPYAQLPGLVPARKLATVLSQAGTVVFDYIDYGDRHQLISFELESESNEAVKRILDRFEFYSGVAELCRSLGSGAFFRGEDTLDETQFRHLTLAFRLLGQSPIPFNGQRYLLELHKEGRRLLAGPGELALKFQMSLALSHGQSALGVMPVISNIRKFAVIKSSERAIVIEASEADLMWDCGDQQTSL